MEGQKVVGSLVPASSPVLIGRDAEIGVLVELATHPPAVALIEGEAGIGKSRLIAELEARCAQLHRRTLVGGCHALRDPFPLGPVVEALSGIDEMPSRRELSPLVGALRPLLPELAGSLPSEPDPSGDARIDLHLLFRAARELLLRLGPTVCVLDDLHWADEGTIEFLRYLIAQLPPTLTLVLSYRGEDLDGSSPVTALIARLPTGVGRARIVLPPLGPDAVRRLVAAILDADDVSQEFAQYLHSKTSGVPFAVEELVQLFLEQRSLVRRQGRWLRRELGDLTVPPAIREAILERVGGLSSDAQRVVEAASVLEVAGDADLLQSVAALDRDRALEGIRAALRAVLLVEVEGGGMVLRHALANQAVYEATPTAVRRDLHARAARALGALAEPPVVQVAHHYRLAGLEREWIPYARAAAEIAGTRGDNEAAARYLRALLSSPELPDADRGTVGVALGWAAVRAVSGQDESLDMLRSLVDSDAVAPEMRGEIRSLLGSLIRLKGDAVSGCGELAQALEELETRPALAALVMSHLGRPWVEQGHVSQHMAWLDRACATAARQDDALVLLAVQCVRAATLAYLGDERAAQAAAALPWQLTRGAEGREMAMLSLELTMADILLGRYQAAWSRLADARQRVEVLGHVSMLDDIDSEAILLRWFGGHWSGLDAVARTHADVFAGIPNRELAGTLVAGLLAYSFSRSDKAEGLLRKSMAVSRAAGLIPSVAIAAGGLTRMLRERDELTAALTVAQEAIDVIRAKEVWAWAAEIAPAAVDALLAAERIAEARELTRDFTAGLTNRDAPAARAAAQYCSAAIAAAEASSGQAAPLFAAAQRAYEALPRPYEAALCVERRATVLLAAGHADPGGVELVEALTRFTTLGATRDVNRVRMTLKRHSVTAPPAPRWRGGRRGYGDELSPQQERVAQLAADGRTNVEIATELFLSPRTVEKHLGVAMQKLGVRSRTALARQWGASTRAGAM